MVADLPLRIDSYSIASLSAAMGPERVRRTTLIRLAGAGEEGVGEDITPVEEDQPTFQEAAPTLSFAGDWTVDSFSSHLATLDLHLRQAGRSLADAVGRQSRPLTFVNSMHLPDPPTFDPIRERLELFPGLRFKLDPTTEWDEKLIAEIAATGAVDTADLKSQYPPPFGQPADPRLYAAVVRAFPDAWIEDPAITPETRPVLEPHLHRVTWDGILWSLADLERLEIRPRAINIKPARFGTVRTLFSVYDYCAANDIAMYGGGFGELGEGRHHIQYLASVFHPDTPNDVAPSGYNSPKLDPGLPTSPLTEVPAATGFRWA
jgi:hypothetical protein